MGKNSKDPEQAGWLCDLISATGMAKQDFAAGAGLSKTQLSNFTTGRQGISLDAAKKIKATYEVPIDYLVTGSLDAVREPLKSQIIEARRERLGRRKRP